MIRDEIESAMRRCDEFPPGVRISKRVTHLGTGVNHDSYIFRLESKAPLPDSVHFAYILRKIARRAMFDTPEEAVESLRREARLLQAVTSCGPRFDSPRFVCFVGESDDKPTGLIETAMPGLPFDQLNNPDGFRAVAPETIAEVAAEIHRFPLDRFDFLERHADARAHLLAELDSRDHELLAGDADAAVAIGWVRDHLPEDRPAVVLHGDLLPQNLMWNIREQEGNRVGVIDWEFVMIGDPAYDLAIVTRGNRRPLKLPNTRQRLLDAYVKEGGHPITSDDLFNWELLFVLGWLEGALRCERNGRREGEGPEAHRQKLRSLLKRAGHRRERIG